MQDILTLLGQMHRPRLLLRAARIGANDYRRAVHLRPLLKCTSLPVSGAALLSLMEVEQDLDKARRVGDAGYSPLRHVSVLIALMGEARLLRASRTEGVLS